MNSSAKAREAKSNDFTLPDQPRKDTALNGAAQDGPHIARARVRGLSTEDRVDDEEDAARAEAQGYRSASHWGRAKR